MLNRTRTSTLDAFGLRDQRNRIYPALTGSDGSTLSLDFTSMSGLDSRFTYTRNSIATFINSSGLVQQVTAAATNDPTKARFDYNPTTLAHRGLLLEGSVTNLATRSEEIMNGVGNWIVGQNTTNTQNTTDLFDPAGTNKATKVVCNANAYCSLAQAISVSGNTQYTFSYWIRGTAGNDNRIYSYAGFTGELTARSTYSYSTTGWTRVQVTFTTNAATTAIYVYAISKQTAPATSDTLYVWGAQLEASSAASSYIPTGTSTVQRAADSCQLTGTNFSSWFNATEGTFLARGQRRLTSNTGMLLSANDATNSEAMGLGSSTTGRWLIRDGGSDVASISPGTVTANTTYRIAGAYAVNDAQAALNSTLGTADTSLTLPTVNQLDIGRDRVSVYLDGYVELIKYWPTRLPNAQLQAITA